MPAAPSSAVSRSARSFVMSSAVHETPAPGTTMVAASVAANARARADDTATVSANAPASKNAMVGTQRIAITVRDEGARASLLPLAAGA